MNDLTFRCARLIACTHLVVEHVEWQLQFLPEPGSVAQATELIQMKTHSIAILIITVPL